MSYLRIISTSFVLLLFISCRSLHPQISEPAEIASQSATEESSREAIVATDWAMIFPSTPVSPTLPKTIASRLDSLMKDTLLERIQASVYVYDLTDGKSIYEFGKKQRMRPASTQKIITSVVALSELGTEHQHRTTLYTYGKQKGKTLTGGICVRGGFDAHLGAGDVNRMVEALLRKGIKRIEGPLLLDLSFKDTLEAGEGWCWDDKNPAMTPLLYNGKDRFAQEFRKALNRKGITLTGSVRLGKVPAEAVARHTCSHSILQTLTPMMKESENQMAESMFYQLAAKNGKLWAEAEEAEKIIKNFINQKLQLDATHYQIADGSGLSPYNYATTELLVAFLQYAYNDKVLRQPFIASLPVAGLDGTLKKRLVGTSSERNIRAKTGTLTGVSSLAGYATAANGHLLCFAIIMQGQRRGSEARQFQDKICNLLTSPVEN